MSTKGERLRDAVKARREELDLNQMEVWQAGGPSNTTLTAIEQGRLETLTKATAQKLDKGLRWRPGSAKAVFEGSGQAEPADATQVILDLMDRVRRTDLSPETKEHILATLDGDLRRAREGGGGDGRRGAAPMTG